MDLVCEEFNDFIFELDLRMEEILCYGLILRNEIYDCEVICVCDWP